MEQYLYSWDSIILFIFFLFFTYNFILGQDRTIKLLLSVYIAILTADGFTTLVRQYITDPSPGFQQILGPNQDDLFMWMRIVLFVVAVILFVAKSNFHVKMVQHETIAYRFFVHAGFSAMGALLFIATILIYLSGNSFAEGITSSPQLSMFQGSQVVFFFTQHYEIWFSLPAVYFLIMSFCFPSLTEE